MDKVSIARNPRARHDYHLLETWEAGLVLTGTEVKSLRAGRASLGESYAHVHRGEVWLEGMTISHDKREDLKRRVAERELARSIKGKRT